MTPGRVLTVSTALLVLLGACSSDDQGGGSATTGSTPGAVTSSSPPSADEVVEEIEVTFGPATLTLEVHPLVRVDEGLVLTLDVTAVDPADVLGGSPTGRLRSIWGSNGGARLPDWVGLRLLDLDGDRVMTPATDAEGDALESVHDGEDGEPSRLQLLYSDVGADELALLVPQGGLVAEIPVIDAEVPVVTDEEPLDLAAKAGEPVSPMSSYTVDLATSTRTEQTVDRVTIDLGADVLFALDSAVLTPGAAGTVAAAAASLQTREPGPVLVAGHTDSSGSDAYNLDLSRRRAAAVAGVLRGLVDQAAYPLRVEGRGESRPAAPNGSEAGRAANRRVELRLETALIEDVGSEAVKQALPPVDGPVATGAQGVDVEVAQRRYRVTAPRASVVDGHLVVELGLTATDDAVRSVFGPAIFEGVYPSPPGLSRIRTMAGVAVLNGSEATIPALHAGDAAMPEDLVPLTDLVTFSRLDGGASRRSVLVFPRGVPVGDTVTIQLLDLYGDAGWRLTDIPVG